MVRDGWKLNEILVAKWTKEDDRERGKGEFHYGWQKLCIISWGKYFLITNFFQVSTRFWTPLKFHKRQNARIKSLIQLEGIPYSLDVSNSSYFSTLRFRIVHELLRNRRGIIVRKQIRLSQQPVRCTTPSSPFLVSVLHSKQCTAVVDFCLESRDAWIGRRGDGQKNSFDVG